MIVDKDISDIESPEILILNSKKDTAINCAINMLYNLHLLNSTIVFSKNNQIFSEHIDSRMILNDVTDDILNNILLCQELNKSQKNKLPKIAVVFDCFGINLDFKSQSVLEIVMNARHYNITAIMLHDNAKLVPDIRLNIDYLIIGNFLPLTENEDVVRNISDYTHLDLNNSYHKETYTDIINEGKMVLIDNRSRSDEFDKKIFSYVDRKTIFLNFACTNKFSHANNLCMLGYVKKYDMMSNVIDTDQNDNSDNNRMINSTNSCNNSMINRVDDDNTTRNDVRSECKSFTDHPKIKKIKYTETSKKKTVTITFNI